MYRYDLKRKTLDFIDSDDCKQNASSCLGMDVSVDAGRLLFCDQERKQAVWFDPQTATFQTETIPTKNRKLLTIQRVKDDLWLAGDRYFCKFDLRTKQAEDLDIFPSGFGNFKRGENGEAILEQDLDQLSEHSFDESLLLDDKVIFVPRKSNMLVVLDTETEKTWGVAIPPETEETLRPGNGRATHSRFIGADRLPDGGVRMFSTQDGAFWDLDGSLTKFHEPEKIDFWKMDFQASEDDHICFEEPSGTTIHRTLETKRASGSAGRRIYEAIMKKMGGHAGG